MDEALNLDLKFTKLIVQVNKLGLPFPWCPTTIFMVESLSLFQMEVHLIQDIISVKTAFLHHRLLQMLRSSLSPGGGLNKIYCLMM
jgi:hypothetical protein